MSDPFNPFAAPESMHHTDAKFVGNYEQLAGVERGLQLVYYGICGIILSAIATAILFTVSPVLGVIGGIAVFISWLMLVIGPFFCLSAPEESGAKGLITMSILFQLSAFLISFAPNIGFGLPPMARFVSQISGTIGSVLFVFFLMRIARFIGREDLRKKGIHVLVFSAVLLCVLVVTGVGVAATGRSRLAVPALIFLAIGGLMLFVMYANLINYLAKAIGYLKARSSAGLNTDRFIG